MIYHKSMLAGACEIARVEKDNPTILLSADGSVVAVNQWAIYTAQPTSEKIKKSLPFKSDEPFKSAYAVSVDQVTGLIKAIPADRQFKGLLEHVSINADDNGFLYCEFNNGKSVVKQRMRSAKIMKALGDWRTRLQGLRESTPAGILSDFVFNRKRLVAVVNAIEAACKYDGEFAFITQTVFPLGYLWKSFNELTGQAVLVAHILPRAGKVPEPSDWEKDVFTNKKPITITLKRKG